MIPLSIQYSFKNLWRNRYSSIATVLLIAIILFVLNILLVVNIIVKNQLAELGQKINMIVYLQDSIDPNKAKQIGEMIKQQPGVKNAVYVSKETALETFLKNHPETGEYYQKFNWENTLPPSIQITVESPDYYGKIQQVLKSSSDSALMTNIAENGNTTITETVTKNLQKLNSFSKSLLFWVIAAFLIGSLLIMNNAVHLAIYHRRLEINIMRLVGAAPMFIRLPYLLEGLWITLAAVMLSSIGSLIVAKTALIPEAVMLSPSLTVSLFGLLSIEIAATLILTLVSSYIAIQSHFQKHMVLS